ncbi:MAG: anaerobic carbon-monoxide dehydrogenase catalytic subunit [Desulfitobacteriaceae bacterium]
MRQVRRKTNDPSARTYLLKAKKEGISLSWNQLESMMPQDGFGLLGLTCQECLQGPCRLNPFRFEETASICGLTRDDLVINGLFRQVSKDSQLRETTHILLQRFFQRISSGEVDQEVLKEKADSWNIREKQDNNSGWLSKALELTAPMMSFGQNSYNDRLISLMTAGACQISLMKFNADLLELLNGKSGITKRKIGLSTLNANSVNVCLDGVSPVVLDLAEEVAEELRLEAVALGASGGFNLVLVGDFSLYHDYNVVSNQGTVEFALLSGIVDLLLVGRENIARGRNLAGRYHTVMAECSASTTKEELKELFRQAALSLKIRGQSYSVTDSDLEIVNVGYTIAPSCLEEALEQGVINGLCIIAGGSNVKVTADEMAVKVIESLSAQKILCLTYGNAAVTLGRYGYLAANEQKDSSVGMSSLDFLNNPVAYCLGGELAASAAVELVQDISRLKVMAVFPEMTEARDLQAAMAFAKAGAKVLTGIKLPIDGSEILSRELGKVIQYCGSKEIVDEALQYFLQ